MTSARSPHLLLTLAGCLLLAGVLNAGENKVVYSSAADLLKDRPFPSEGVPITVEGPLLKTPSGHTSCVYGESAIFYDIKQTKAVGQTAATEGAFNIVLEGKEGGRARLQVRPDSTLRLFVSPTFVRSFTKDNAPAQEVDYCLQRGKTYYLRIQREEIEYGPPLPDGSRSSHTYYFLQVSDRPFKDGRPQVEPTPTFRHWIYS